MFYFLIALAVLVIDQISKWLIVTRMKLHETHSVIGEFFQITSHRNSGAAFSILEGQRWFFVSITIVIAIGLVWYLRKMIKEQKTLLCWALAILLGGALGNFIDRALFGEVVDFLQFHFEFSFFGKQVDYTFAIFNMADTFIFIGVCLLLLDTLIEWRKEKREKADEAHES